MRLKDAAGRPFALAALLAALPLLLLIAVAVRLSGPGPVIHRRRVLGLGGRPFDALKFRTMYPDADARLMADPSLGARFAARHKLADDPRVTPLGWWLRRYSLDELPQLLNVVRGDMWLVGPRMISPQELERFGPHQPLLLSVRPGLTGLWQVSGRQTTSYERRVELDVAYITRWSVWLDVSILLRTPGAIIGATGAW